MTIKFLEVEFVHKQIL